MIFIDFASCSDTLESMVFDYFGDYRIFSPREEREFLCFTDSIKKLHNLKNLTLMQNFQFTPLLESVQSLKNLRLKEYSFKSMTTTILLIN